MGLVMQHNRDWFDCLEVDLCRDVLLTFEPRDLIETLPPDDPDLERTVANESFDRLRWRSIEDDLAIHAPRNICPPILHPGDTAAP